MDTSCIDAARRGDRQAQGVLLRQLQDPWYRMCLSLLRDADLARDATQETALRFLKQLPSFRGSSSLSTWSMGIAINVVREMRRKRGLVLAGEDESEPLVPSRDLSPDMAASAGEQREALQAILDQLPQRQREAVILRFFEDLSVEETAAAMGCAQGTIKATIHQALRSLKRRLDEARSRT